MLLVFPITTPLSLWQRCLNRLRKTAPEDRSLTVAAR